ncbi:TonB-dependent receptor plug domain-containing protein [Sporomusa aerivorans]|uniref:TonB-dependent receptor plug domain-containing protein n=1 Tax=Sporomusa aerivorans TaxID=204936 RepID=UPI00352A7006
MNRRTKGLLFGLICGAISLGVTNDIYAEEQEFDFDEYVVTASRIPVKKNEVAANVTVIGKEEIEKGAYSKISDILTRNNVTMGTSSVASYPIINGDDRVLIMVDGRKMNWSHYVTNGSFNGLNIDNIAVKNIERIEIVRGPNSSLYGSAAVGGVINIITKQAKENNTILTTEFGTWNSQRYALTTEGVEKDISYIFTYDKQKRDNFDYKNPKTGQNREFNSSEIDKEYTNLRIDKQLGNDDELSLTVESMESNGGFGLCLRDVDTGVVYNPDTRRKLSDFNVALTYSWNKDKGAANSFRIYQNNSEATTHYSTSLYKYDVKATGAEWQQSWMVNEKSSLVGGAELRKDQSKELTSGTNLKGEITTSALFVENRLKLKNDLALTLGSRYDHHSTFGGDVTSHISLNKALSPETNVYVSWGQAVKNPRILDLYANTPSWLGNKDLKPETADTITIGMDTKLDGKTTLQSSIYKSDLKNAIAWQSNVVGSQGMYVNINREKRQGLELNIKRQLSDQWNVNAGYSYSKVEKQNGTDAYALDLLNTRPNGYSLGVQYKQDKWDAGLMMLAATGRSEKAYTSDSYLTLDMNLRYQAAKDTMVYLKGYNLTNEAYEMVSYSTTAPGKYPMAGRSFVIGVEQRL